MKIGDIFIVRDLIDGMEFLAIVSATDYEEGDKRSYATILSLGVTIQIDDDGTLIGFKGDALDRYYSSRVFRSSKKREEEQQSCSQEKKEREKIEKFIARYKSIANKSEDFVLTSDNVDDWIFTHTCTLEGWYYDVAKTKILGEPWWASAENSDENA